MYDVPKNPQAGDKWAPVVLSSRQQELISDVEAALQRAGLHGYLYTLQIRRYYEERPYTFINGCWQRKEEGGVGFISENGRCVGFDNTTDELAEPPRSLSQAP